jgi:PAS domain S-box-containing protein
MTIRDIALEKNTPSHLLETGEIPIVALSNVEARRYRKKDGAVIDVEVTSHGLTFEGRDAELVLAHDITERNKSQERLRQSEERFSKAFQCSPLAITISTTAECRYVDVNDAFLQLTGCERADVIGHTIDDLRMWVEPKDRILLVQSINEAKRVRALATQFRTRSGEARFVKVSAELIHLDQVSCVLAITEDVTEVKRLEQQSRQAQTMQAVGRLDEREHEPRLRCLGSGRNGSTSDSQTQDL